MAIVVECFMFATFGWGVFPTYPMFDLGMILFFAFLIFSCRTRSGANTFLCIVLGVQIVVSYINIIMKNMLNTVFSVNMIALVGETAEVVTLSMFPFAPIIFFGIVIAILAISLTFLGRIPVDESKVTIVNRYAMRFAVLIGMVLSMGLYTMQGFFLKKYNDERYLLGDDYLYNTFSSGSLSLRKFGTYSYYLEQVSRLFVDVDDLYKVSEADLAKYLETETYNPKDSAIWNAFAKGGDNNLFVIMAESFEWYAISPEITPVLYGLANGYDFGKAGDQTELDPIDGIIDENGVALKDGWRLYEMYNFFNTKVDVDGNEYDYLDLLRKDYTYNKETNTFSKIEGTDGALSEPYNPNLNENFGLTLINYYSKAKTDYSEASVILGNYPFNKSFVEYNIGFGSAGLYSDVNYNFTLPNVLKDSGYLAAGDASYFHTYQSQFYGRTTLMPQFGFDDATFFEYWSKNPVIETGNNLTHAILDSQVMSVYGNKFIHRDQNGQRASDKPWLSFFTTVTTHGEFSTYNARLKKHYAFMQAVDYAGKPSDVEFKNFDKNNSFWKSPEGYITTYLAGALDTEYMVAHLINYLIQYNEFSNTTIVFYGDHNAYYDHLDYSSAGNAYKAYYYSNYEGSYQNFRSEMYKGNSYAGEYGLYSSERYAVPCFIYATDLDHNENGTTQYVQKFTCAFDITPTLFTMCGIEYNPHYYMGYPAICPQTVNGVTVEQGSKLIASHTGGYFNNKIFSEDAQSADYMAKGVTTEDVRLFSLDCAAHLEKWKKITALYDYNKFAKVSIRAVN